ncbi:GRL1A polymerase, partial [Eubucco bourcierii]|nr:GRL1A polymerase [Eubucco bourcierii]
VLYVFCLRKFISRLPDKGKKISDFAEKLMFAIVQEEELARTAELLSAVRLEFQVKQEEINTSKRQIMLNEDTLSHEDSSLFNKTKNVNKVSEISSQRQDAEHTQLGDSAKVLDDERTQKKDNEVKTVAKDQNLFCEVISKSATNSHLRNDQQVSQSNTEDGTENIGALDNDKDALVD